MTIFRSQGVGSVGSVGGVGSVGSVGSVGGVGSVESQLINRLCRNQKIPCSLFPVPCSLT